MERLEKIKSDLRDIRDGWLDRTSAMMKEGELPMISIRELVADCVRAIIVELDTGKIVWASAIAEETFGYIPGELVEATIHDLVPPALREQHRSHFARFAADPRPRQMGDGAMKLSGVKRDGSVFPIEIGLYPRAFAGKRYVVATIMPMRSGAQS